MTLFYHFLAQDRRLRYGDERQVELGVPLSCSSDKPLKLCEHGMHASRTLLDALQYAPGLIACEVTLDENGILEDTDKVCSHTRTVVRWCDMSSAIVEFAQWCAERAQYCEVNTWCYAAYINYSTEAAAWRAAYEAEKFDEMAILSRNYAAYCEACAAASRVASSAVVQGARCADRTEYAFQNAKLMELFTDSFCARL